MSFNADKFIGLKPIASSQGFIYDRPDGSVIRTLYEGAALPSEIYSYINRGGKIWFMLSDNSFVKAENIDKSQAETYAKDVVTKEKEAKEKNDALLADSSETIFDKIGGVVKNVFYLIIVLIVIYILAELSIKKISS